MMAWHRGQNVRSWAIFGIFCLWSESKNIVKCGAFMFSIYRKGILQHAENCTKTSFFARSRQNNTINTVVLGFQAGIYNVFCFAIFEKVKNMQNTAYLTIFLGVHTNAARSCVGTATSRTTTTTTTTTTTRRKTTTTSTTTTTTTTLTTTPTPTTTPPTTRAHTATHTATNAATKTRPHTATHPPTQPHTLRRANRRQPNQNHNHW